MTWVRIDDHFDEHPKLAQAGTVCWGVWLAGIAYCNRNLTDGFIPWTVAHSLGSWDMLELEPDETTGKSRIWTIARGCGLHGEDMDTEWILARLVGVGLWDEIDDGYRIHDYSDYQPSKAEVLEQRQKNSERVADWRKRNKVGNTVGNAVSNRLSNAVSTPTPVPVPGPVPISKPVPSRAREPEPTNGVTPAQRKTNLEDALEIANAVLQDPNATDESKRVATKAVDKVTAALQELAS